MSLDSLEGAIRARLPDLTGLNYVVQFDLGDDGVFTVDGNAMPPVLTEDVEEADCTIRLSPSDLQKLIDGDLNPTLAYTLGKLKVSGSMGVALKVASMLEE